VPLRLDIAQRPPDDIDRVRVPEVERDERAAILKPLRSALFDRDRAGPQPTLQLEEQRERIPTLPRSQYDHSSLFRHQSIVRQGGNTLPLLTQPYGFEHGRDVGHIPRRTL
jgi:hypothetical protein